VLLSDLTLSPALAQVPATGELLVCDASTGDIFRCSPQDGNCTMEVDCDNLNMPNAGIFFWKCMLVMCFNALHGLILSPGLPAASLIVSDERIYWSGPASNPGIFAVNFMAPSNVIVISPSTVASSLHVLSPDQQKLSCELSVQYCYSICFRYCQVPSSNCALISLADLNCLSLNFIFATARPDFIPEEVNITNTTLFLPWRFMDPPRPDNCPFSTPPYTFCIEYEIEENKPFPRQVRNVIM